MNRPLPDLTPPTPRRRDGIMDARFPVPRYIIADQHKSEARFLICKLNPSVTHNSTDVHAGQGHPADDVSLKGRSTHEVGGGILGWGPGKVRLSVMGNRGGRILRESRGWHQAARIARPAHSRTTTAGRRLAVEQDECGIDWCAS